MKFDFPATRDSFFRPFEEVFDKFYNETFSSKFLPSVKNNINYPKINVISKDNNFVIQVACPGVNEKDLKVEIVTDDYSNEDLVHISGKMSSEYTSEDYRIKELSTASFSRYVKLPDTVEGDPVAVLKSGILTLTWKTTPVKPLNKNRTISILNQD